MRLYFNFLVTKSHFDNFLTHTNIYLYTANCYYFIRKYTKIHATYQSMQEKERCGMKRRFFATTLVAAMLIGTVLSASGCSSDSSDGKTHITMLQYKQEAV